MKGNKFIINPGEENNIVPELIGSKRSVFSALPVSDRLIEQIWLIFRGRLRPTAVPLPEHFNQAVK